MGGCIDVWMSLWYSLVTQEVGQLAQICFHIISPTCRRKELYSSDILFLKYLRRYYIPGI